MKLPGAMLLATILTALCCGAALAKEKEIRVGIYENPPLVSFADNDAPRGLFVDIIRHVAEKEGWVPRFITGTWTENIARLDVGEIDLLPAIAVSKERALKYDFIDQHVISNWGQLFVPPDSPIKAIPDLDGKSIAVLKDDIYVKSEHGMPALCERFSLRCKFVELDSYTQVIQAVADGRADTGLVNRLFGLTSGRKFKVEPSAIIFMPLDIRVALSRSSKAAHQFGDALDRNLRDLKNDKQSVYYRSINSILSPARVVEKIPGWVIWLIAGAIVLMVLLIAGNQLLRWKVRTRTQALSLSESRYRELFEEASISIWEEDMSALFSDLATLRENGLEDLHAHLDENPDQIKRLAALVRVVDVNSATLEMLSAETKKELLEGLHKVFTENAVDVFRQGLEAIWEGKPAFTAEAEHRTMDGRTIQVLVSHPIPRTQNNAHCVPVIVLDMTDSKRTAGDLINRETQLRTLIDTLPDLVWLKDADGVYLSCNSRFESFFGATEAEIVGKTDYEFVEKDLADFFREHDRAAMASGGPSRNEEDIVYADDGHHEVLETIKTPMYGADGHLMGVLGVGRDITLRKQQEEHILHQAHFDMLTDLPNRFLSLDRLSQLLSDASRTDHRVAVLFLDLDDFKRINDTLGHETGDSLLIEAGERLRAAVRQVDTVGRLGGDEFIVLLGGLKNPDDAQPVMENLLGCFRDTFTVSKRELIVTASIGAAVYPEDGSNPTELLRNADSAMYHAKGMGRNTYSYFTHTMNSEVSRRFSLEEQMHGALSRGEFYVQYQPQLDIRTGAIVGIEALLRWKSPSLGEISPTEFIPIAEHTGMIIPIGEFVISEALATLAGLRRRHARELRVAVNMSPRQFRDPNLVPNVTNAMHTHGLVGRCLEFEITEGVLMGGYSYIDKAFSALCDLDVNLAMDDFGTGYSSLSYLRQYPFDVIKIDRSFVSGITRDSADRELIGAAVAMAHGLGLKVVAEGVETEAQLACLTELGCDLVQGYLFSKAVFPEEIQDMLELPVLRSM